MTETREQIERATLCCVLHDPERALAVAINAGCTAEWFDDDNRRRIWQSIEARYGAARPCDYLSLCQHTRDPKLIAEMDIAQDLAIIPAYADHYIEAMRGHWVYDKAVELAHRQLRVIEAANPIDADTEYDAIRESWQTLGAKPTDTATLGDIARAKVAEWIRPPRERPNRVHWPLAILQRHIGPLSNELVYICAAESVGKTAMVLQLLVENGKQGIRGEMASLESSRERLVPRLLSQLSGQNTLEADRGHACIEALREIQAAADSVDSLGFGVTDRPMSCEQLHAWGKLCKARGARYLVVDNTRHIKVRQRFASKVDEFSHVSLRLKGIRDDLQLPVIALHHANTHGDVSWSQDLRRDVDILLLMSVNEARTVVPSAANEWRGEWWVDVMIDKHRDGRKGIPMCLRFAKEQQRFEED